MYNLWLLRTFSSTVIALNEYGKDEHVDLARNQDEDDGKGNEKKEQRTIGLDFGDACSTVYVVCVTDQRSIHPYCFVVFVRTR